jgi:adenylate cyclase
MAAVPQKVFRFEGFTLDLTRRSLRAGDRSIELRPKSFDVLAYLVERAGTPAGKDEIIQAVWPDVTVTEESLTRCVSDIRLALDDSRQRIIKTLPRRGYLLAAPATGTDPGDTANFVPHAGGGAEKNSTAALALPDRPSIAVLPLDNTSGDKDQDYFSDGITEDIITELSRFSELFVIARNSSFQYKGKAIDVRQVGRHLGVRYILQGSIRREGGRVRISAQLADAVTGTHRWAERYDRQIEDVFAVQDEVARTIVTILAAHVNKAEIERSLSKPPETWQAYDYYLRAADAYASYQSSYKAIELYEVRRLLEQSLSIDPNYARAYARLALTHTTAWLVSLDDDYLNPPALDRAYQLARKAVQLDPNLPEAHAVLGQVLCRRREHDAAVAEFERSMALNPNFTDYRFAEVLVFAGDPVRAIEAVERHMRSDPFHVPLAPGHLGLAHYMLKQYSQALPFLRECVSRAPNFRAGHVWLAATFAQLGNIEQARAEAAEVLRIESTYTIEGTQARLSGFKRPEDAEHFFDGLRKAGLPER